MPSRLQRLPSYKMSQVSDDTSDLLIEVQEPPGKRRKPKRPLSVSPEKVQESLQNLPGGNCFKCKQVLGADSKAVQCDLCGAWIHVKCEGVSDEVYSKLNAVLGDLSNLAYYFESNNCSSKIKQLLYACFIDKKLEATQYFSMHVLLYFSCDKAGEVILLHA